MIIILINSNNSQLYSKGQINNINGGNGQRVI